MNLIRIAVATVYFTLATSIVHAEDSMRLAVTTSFNNSGLSDILLPKIKQDTGLEVQMLVVGTGQALKLGRQGDVDAILVHSKSAEEEFVSQGYGTHRREIMYNDFVLIGPSNDPANINQSKSANEAFAAIEKTKAPFVSRGDDSGTHKKEIAIWKSLGLDNETLDPQWYHAAGSGMGSTLNTASAMNAYVFSDRASWLKFGNKNDLKLLYSGDPKLFNQYAYLPVNPTKHPHAKNDMAKKLEHWLVSDEAQAMIEAYEIDGNKLFTPNAKPQ